MKRVVFGTTNPGKLADARLFADREGIEVLTPKDFGVDIDPEETGETFDENAWIKYNALRPLIPKDVVLVTEDGGLSIDALNGEPGVHSRRWNGTRMTDQEIVDYTVEKMKGQANRKAKFIISSVIGGGGIEPQILHHQLDLELLKEPDMDSFEEGFPYRAFMYVPALGKMLHNVHAMKPEERPGFLTHREQAWKQIAKMVRDLE